MDNFMDKLAQRLTAQEMIKANSSADAAELERLQKQLAQYDACLQEMRKLSLKNVEATDKIGLLLDESIHKIQEIEAQKEDTSSYEKLLEDEKSTLMEQKEILQKALEEQKETLSALEGMVKESDETMQAALREFLEKTTDFVHKENVKVYRNVQAVVVDEGKKQTEALETSQKKAAGKNKAILTFTVLTFVAVLADVAVNLLIHFGIF